MAVEGGTIEVESWRDALAVLWAHWRTEIGLMLRETSGDTARAGMLRLSFAGGTVTASRGGVVIAQVPASKDGADRLSGLLDDDPYRDTWLQFDEAQVLRAPVRLPRSSAGARRGALGFEMERLSPIAPSELYYDAKIDHAGPRHTELTSRAIRRQTVDAAVAFAHQADCAVAGMLLGGDDGPADWRHFPVDRNAALRGLWRRWGSAVLFGLAAAIALAVLIAWTARSAAQIDALDARIADAERNAAPVTQMVRTMDRMHADAAYLAQLRVKPGLAATLAALTDALPDGTWLTDIQFDDGQIRIQGYSHSAANLVALLLRSGRFTDANFTAPLVRNDQDGTDRFELTAKVKR